MAEDDIYHNKARYEKFVKNLDRLLTKPEPSSKRKYYCKNRENLDYFREFHRLFERKDNSYIRRLRVFRILLMIVSSTDKNLSACTREDVDEIVTISHNANRSPKSKEDFIKDLKFIWRYLFPEKDEKGRIDETITPYVVRHLFARVDKSRQKLRNDKLTLDEFDKIVSFFNSNPQMQLYIALAIESLGRPQEICYTRIRDVEVYESYAKIYISSHGKEGVKFLQCIDSYPYLIKWLENHPYSKFRDAFLFITNSQKDRQLTPYNINQKLKFACRKLGIDKNITAYSLKRNGVTFARLRGDSDVDIQHRAGWTSTKQIRVYDLSTSDDSFKKALAQRGLIKEEEYKELLPKTKKCICGSIVGFADKICLKCKRLLDKEEIRQNMVADNILSALIEKMAEKNKNLLLEAVNELKIKGVINKI